MSSAGSVEFQRSFFPRGMTASLIRGSPRREICTHCRLVPHVTAVLWKIRTRWRLAVAYTPMTAFGLVCVVQLVVTRQLRIGTCSTIECVL